MSPQNTSKVNLVALFNLIALTMIISLIVFLLQDYLIILFNETNFDKIAQLTPLLSLSFIPRTLALKLMYRDRNMKKVFLINLFFFGTIASLIFYSLYSTIHLNFTSLSTYYIIGAIASSVIGILVTYPQLIFSFNGHISLRELYSFSWKITYNNILHTVPKQIDIFIIKLFFTTEIVGLYAAAKSLYRLFDEAINATYGLLYPTAVKYIRINDYVSVNALINKSISFIFWFFTFSSLFIISPVGIIVLSWIFPENYIQSLSYLKLMVMVTPLLSFIVFYSIITAEGKLQYLFKGVIAANVGFFVVILTICYTNSVSLLPMGLVAFFGIFGAMGLYFGITKYDYKLRYLLVAFPDTINFIKKILKSSKFSG